MKKRTLALILAVVLMLSVAIPGTLAVSQDSDSTTATLTVDEPVVAEVPEVTETPEATETPVPEVTEAPEVTETPVPEVTEAPEATETPAPEVTEAPEATETPATETPAPEATETPEAPAADLVSVNREAIFDPAGVTLYADIGSDDCVFADLPDDFTFTVRYEFADEDGALWYMLNTEDWADYPEYAAYPFIPEESIAFTDEMIPTTLEIVQPTPPPAGTTTGNPFPKGTGGSNSFRIPAMVTLSNGTIVAAADARWNTTYDGGGLDTIVARSSNGGASWGYTFANYLGDNGNSYNGSGSTAFIDPSLVAVGGTVYMLCDLYPYGVALNGSDNTQPVTTKGFDSNGRLLLSNNNHNSYDYYLDGDTIRSSDGTAVDGYTVDGYFDLYQNGDYVSNLFFSDSPYQVVRTGYLYLTRSTDGGETWSEPTLLNLKNSSEMVCLVGPGRGLYADGKIIFPVYSYNGEGTQKMGFIWSTDGVNWYRSANFTGATWSSEAAVVALADGTLRFFYRNGTSKLCYVDYNNGWGSAVTTDIATNSNTQLSAISYSKTLDGKQVILVSCPTGADGNGSSSSSASARLNGKIFVFTVGENNALEPVSSYAVPSVNSSNQFMYSCLAELSGGSVAILYEDCESAWGTGDSCYYTMSYKTYTAEELGLAEAGGDTGSNTMTDEQTGVTVALPEGETISSLSVTAGETQMTATTVSKSYEIEINGGDYTGKATVTVPYDTAFDGCTVSGTVGTDTFTVTREGDTFVCDAPHFSTLTITGTRAAGDAGSESITLKVGETSNAHTLTGTAAAGTFTTTDGVAKYTVANNKTEASTTVTYKNSISAGDQIVISDGNGNYLKHNGTTITNTTDPADATVWKVGGNSVNGYTLKSGDYYYLSHNNTALSVGTSSSTWSYDGGGFYYSYYSYYIRKGTSNWTLDWYSQDNRGKAYTVTTIPGSSSTTVTFTGVKPGTTTVTLGGTTFDVTVQALSESKTVNVQTESEFTLAPLADLGLSADDGYAISSYNVTAGADLITRGDGSQFTAGTTDGTATVVATVSKDGATVGTVTYSVVVSSYTDKKNIYVPVGQTAEITGLNGALDTSMLNGDIATATLDGQKLTIEGKIIGETQVAVGNVLISVHVVNVNGNEEYKNVSRYLYVYVEAMENCKVYYTVNGTGLYEVKGTGVLVDETVNGGFHLMFFAAPNEGYALVEMANRNTTNTTPNKGESWTESDLTLSPDYYCLSNGEKDAEGKEDVTTSSAWPLNANGSYKAHGFQWCLKEGNMTQARMKEVFELARAKGCDGATNITKNAEGAGGYYYFSFRAEKLPEIKKEITRYQKGGEGEWLKIEKNTELEFGDVVEYTFTITKYRTEVYKATGTTAGAYTSVTQQNVTYEKVGLNDWRIGYGAAENPVDITDDFNNDSKWTAWDKENKATLTITKTYTINRDDFEAGKYEGGKFENEIELTYKYSSAYSTGSYDGSIKGQVSCNIKGMVTYKWDEGLPTAITSKTLPADQAPKYGTTVTVTPSYTTVKQGDQVETDEGVYTFQGWKNESLSSEKKLYQQGDTFTMPEAESVVFTGIWAFEPYVTIKYEVVGPEGCGTVSLASETLLESSEDAQGSTATANANFRFVGWYTDEACTQPVNTAWVTDNKIVPKKIDGKNVGATYYAKFEYDTTSLTITKKIADGSDPDQSFVFTVTDGRSTITVALNPDDFKKGSASKIITGLTVGTEYTVTEDTTWSWRYEQTDVTPANGQITLTANGTNEVTFTNRVKNTKWLDDSVAAVNKYGDSGTKRFD